MRPGAGQLPALALGRSRGCTAEPACTDPGVAAVGPTAGALPVTLLRSAPRQAYRIYSEEEFLAAEDWQVEAEPELALLGQADRQRGPRRWGRVAVLAALASVLATVVGVVALNATRSRSESARGFAGRITARGRSPRIVADRSSIRPLDTYPRKRIRLAYVSVRRIAERRPAPAGRPPVPAHPYTPPQPPPPASPPAPTPVSAPASAATESPKVTARTATTASNAHGVADAEFGFERR